MTRYDRYEWNGTGYILAILTLLSAWYSWGIFCGQLVRFVASVVVVHGGVNKWEGGGCHVILALTSRFASTVKTLGFEAFLQKIIHPVNGIRQHNCWPRLQHREELTLSFATY